MKLIVTMKGVDTLSLRTKKLIAAAMTGVKFGVSEAAQLFVDEAKALVPVKTGTLRDAIHAELGEVTSTRVTAIVTPVYEEAGTPEGFWPPYARRVEFGFMGQDSRGRNYHQAAQPYMRPAFDSKQAEAREAIRESVFQELDAVRR